MARLICDSMSDTRSIQPNPFQQATRAGNARRPCNSFPRLNLNAWRDLRSNPLNTGKIKSRNLNFDDVLV